MRKHIINLETSFFDNIVELKKYGILLEKGQFHSTTAAARRHGGYTESQVRSKIRLTSRNLSEIHFIRFAKKMLQSLVNRRAYFNNGLKNIPNMYTGWEKRQWFNSSGQNLDLPQDPWSSFQYSVEINKPRVGSRRAIHKTEVLGSYEEDSINIPNNNMRRRWRRNTRFMELQNFFVRPVDSHSRLIPLTRSLPNVIS